jgi:hypothetical protein
MRGRHVGRDLREGGEEVLEAFPAQQPARVGDHAGVGGQTKAGAGGLALAGGGRMEADGIDAVRNVRDLLRGHSGGQELVADQPRHGHEAVGVAEEQVARARSRANGPAERGGRKGLAPGVDLARHLAVHFRLEDHALPRRARGQHSGQAEHARATHDEDVVGAAQTVQRRQHVRDHAVLAGAAGARRRHAHDVHALECLVRRPTVLSPAREHGDRRARAGEVTAEGTNMALAAAQDRMERLREEKDADQRPGVTRSRSGSGSGCAAGGISFTT